MHASATELETLRTSHRAWDIARIAFESKMRQVLGGARFEPQDLRSEADHLERLFRAWMDASKACFGSA